MARLNVGRNYEFSIDSPRKKLLDSRTLIIEGWIFSKKPATYQLRVRNNRNLHSVTVGLKRPDVAKTHPEPARQRTLHSGFRAEFVFEDGEVVLEINEGNGFKKLYRTDVSFG